MKSERAALWMLVVLLLVGLLANTWADGKDRWRIYTRETRASCAAARLEAIDGRSATTKEIALDLAAALGFSRGDTWANAKDWYGDPNTTWSWVCLPPSVLARQTKCSAVPSLLDELREAVRDTTVAPKEATNDTTE